MIIRRILPSLLTVGLALLFIVALAYGLVWAFQTSFIYLTKTPSDSRNDIRTPDQVGFSQYEDIPLKSIDGAKTHGYWIPYQTLGTHQKATTTASGTNANPKRPTILYLHGNAGNLGHRLPMIARLMKATKANIFLLSYRGYGRSEGSPSESGITKDAQTAFRYLLDKREVDSARIILMGHSLGAAVAFSLAVTFQAKIQAIVAEATWLSIPLLIQDTFSWPLRLSRYAISETWNNQLRLNEMIDTAIATNSFPSILLISNGMDNVVPSEHSDRLAALIEKGLKEAQRAHFEHKIFPTAEHLGIHDQPVYFETIGNFFEKIKRH